VVGVTTISAAAPAPVRRPAGTRTALVLPLALVAGIAAGALTSWGQTVLGGTWFAGLANAVSPWIVTSFAVGALARRSWVAALAGLLVCAGEVAGYYVAAELRGFGVGTAAVAMWVVAGVVGGPLFGWAGRQWRTGEGRWRGVGAALLVGCWLAEALVTYGLVLRYGDDAVVFAGIGVLLAVVLSRQGRQGRALLRWTPAALAAGVVGFLVLQVGGSLLLTGEAPDLF
jgi:hypothetical protein